MGYEEVRDAAESYGYEFLRTLSERGAVLVQTDNDAEYRLHLDVEIVDLEDDVRVELEDKHGRTHGFNGGDVMNDATVRSERLDGFGA